MRVRLCVVALIGVLPLLLDAEPASAQGALGRLKRRAEEEVRRRTEEKADRAVDKTLDGIEDAIRCAATDAECIKRAESSGKKVVVTDSGTTKAEKGGSAEADGASAVARPGQGAWANYDFIPGERPLVVTDFTKDVVGDFPKQLEASEGNFEVVEWKGARWLRANGHANRMLVSAKGLLPARWTLEFDIMGESGECWIYP